jgi:lantibiotic modifying enzyme
MNTTRRNWMRASAAAAAFGPAVATPAQAAPARTANKVAGPDLLLTAKEAARWIQSAARSTDAGTYWLLDPDHPDAALAPARLLPLYGGNAGIPLFLLQLAKATGDTGYREQALKGADYLVNHWKDLTRTEAPAAGQRGPAPAPYGFYGGLAGVAFALAEIGKWSGEKRYRDSALEVTELIVQAAKPAGKGITWTGTAGLSGGDTGIALYLLYAAGAFQNNSYQAPAAKAGEHIVELSEKDPRGGIRWLAPGRGGGLGASLYFPNFELGTAGVAYGLTQLYAATKNERFLEAARQGALHLQKIAKVAGDTALIPYREPDLPDLYYLGFCHGPTGTARLFFALHQATREKEYLDWTERLARGITESGVPEQLTPGFWYVACQCCGLAGVTDFFLGLWAGTRKPEYLAFAQRAALQAHNRATTLENKGARWYQAYTRIRPAVVNAETSYMIGAAGIAAALLHAHLAAQRKYETIVFPDNPFPAAVSG